MPARGKAALIVLVVAVLTYCGDYAPTPPGGGDAYGELVKRRSVNPGQFVPFALMPGNAADPLDKSVCWQPLPKGGS